jgi:hypothetical protein
LRDERAVESVSDSVPGDRATSAARASDTFSVAKKSERGMSRSIALVVIVFALLWAIHARTSSLDVIVEMRPPADGGPAELFFAFGEQGFHPRRSHAFQSDEQRAFSWHHGGGRALSRIRIDPTGGSGEVSVGSVSLAGPAGELVLEGAVLLKASNRSTRWR